MKKTKTNSSTACDTQRLICVTDETSYVTQAMLDALGLKPIVIRTEASLEGQIVARTEGSGCSGYSGKGI
jgi:hypothetical protein